MNAIAKKYSVSELVAMTSKQRYEYIRSLKLKLTRTQIAHETNYSRALVDHVFSGTTKNEKIFKVILENISDDDTDI